MVSLKLNFFVSIEFKWTFPMKVFTQKTLRNFNIMDDITP